MDGFQTQLQLPQPPLLVLCCERVEKIRIRISRVAIVSEVEITWKTKRNRRTGAVVIFLSLEKLV